MLCKFHYSNIILWSLILDKPAEIAGIMSVKKTQPQEDVLSCKKNTWFCVETQNHDF